MNDLAANHGVSPLADANAPQAAGNLTRKRLIAMLLALEGMNVDTNYRRLMKITFGVFEMPIAEERNDPVKY